MSLKILLVRHGSAMSEEEDEDGETFRQRSSSPLNTHGDRMAHLTGKLISGFSPQVLLTSPYVRARQTADIIARYSPLFPNVIDELREIRRVVDGVSVYSDLNREYKKWRGEIIRNANLNGRFRPPDMTYGELFEMVTRFKYRLIREFEDQVVVVCGHSQSFGMLIGSMLLGDDPDPHQLFRYFNKYFMSHCGITQLTFDYRRGWTLKDFNNTSHLR